MPIIQNKIISVMLDYTLSHSHGFYQNSLSGKISKQITNLSDSIVDIITFKLTNFLRGASLLVASPTAHREESGGVVVIDRMVYNFRYIQHLHVQKNCFSS